MNKVPAQRTYNPKYTELIQLCRARAHPVPRRTILKGVKPSGKMPKSKAKAKAKDDDAADPAVQRRVTGKSKDKK